MIGLVSIPILAQRWSNRVDKSWLSPVLICYGVGILLANIPGIPLNDSLSETTSQGSIILAIPLLLFSTRLLHWIRHAQTAVFSFMLAVVAAVAGTITAAWTMQSAVEYPALLSGMLSGLYTGGTPNMQAVGIALKAPKEYIVLINAADVILGGSWLIFLISVSPMVMGRIFRPFTLDKQQVEVSWSETQTVHWQSMVIGILLALAVCIASAGLTFWLFGHLDEPAFLLFTLTSLSLLLSAIPSIRNLPGTMVAGEYLLLVFSLAIGLLADLSTLASSGLVILGFCTIAKVISIATHLILARLFNIDRDTYLITSTAALYGPVFVPQVAKVLGNKQLIFAGISTGLLGYAIGNYLGLSVATFLGWLL